MLLALATQTVSIAVTSTVFNAYILLSILFMHRLFRNEDRYRPFSAAVQLTDRYDHPLADQEPALDTIRNILRDDRPTSSHLPATLDQ